MLTALTGEYHSAQRHRVMEFIHLRSTSKISDSETLITHRRTVTEADIVNFGCVSGDIFMRILMR